MLKTSRRGVRLLPMTVTMVLAAASVATATAAGASTAAARPAPRASLRASVLHDMDSPLAAQARARAKSSSHVVAATATPPTPRVLRSSVPLVVVARTPTLVYTALNSQTNAFSLQTKNLLNGVVTNILQPSSGNCPIGPQLSPDSTKVVYVDYGSQCLSNGQINVLDRTTGTVTATVPTGTDYLVMPNWSADGSTILYTDEVDDSSGVFVSSSLMTVPAGGGSPTAITGGGVNAYDGVYSPDGTKIVFAPTTAAKAFLSVMNADGTSPFPLSTTINNLNYWPEHPAWSADGTKVSFTYVKSHTTYLGTDVFLNGIGVAAADNSSETNLLVTSSSRLNAFYSTWSADSTGIYFDMLVRDPVTGSNLTNAGVYATDATGTRRATLLSDTTYAYDGVSFNGDSPSTGAASTYNPLPVPVRVLPRTPLGPGAVTNVQIAGANGIPAMSATPAPTAVTLNLTGVSPTATTYLQAYPTPGNNTFPLVSNLNLVPRQISAVAVQVTLSSSGSITIRNASGTTGVIVDVSGYFTAGAGADQYVPITPVRAEDTTLAANGTVPVTVTGDDPANTALVPDAVVLNFTGATPTTPTYLQAYPTPAVAGPPPTISSLNLATRETRANLVTVALGTDAGHTVTIRNNAGTVRAIVDVVGYYYKTAATGGLSYYPLAPTRFLDTRSGTDTYNGSIAPLAGGTALPVQMRGTATTSSGMVTVPAAAQAYVFNMTAVTPTANTYLTVYPAGATPPGSSNLNAAIKTVVPNLVITGTTAGAIDIFSSSGNTALVIDLAGYYA